MNWTIGRRLAAGSAIPACVIIAMMVGVWVSSGKLGVIQDDGVKHSHSALLAETASNMGAKLYEVIADAELNRNFSLSDSEWRKVKGSVETLFATVDALAEGPDQKRASRAGYDAFHKMIAVYEGTLLPLLRASNAVTQEIKDIDQSLDELVKLVDVSYEAVRDGMKTEAEKVNRLFDETRHSMVITGLFVGILALLGTIAATILINRSITLPIWSLDAAMRRLADGDNSVDVPNLGRGDEIGTMAATVQVFKGNAEEMVRLRDDQERQRQEAEHEKREAMRRLADGFDSTIKSMVTAVAAAARQMEANAKALSETADNTKSQSHVVADAAHSASSNVQTVASATEELAASVNEISRQVTESNRIATAAAGDAARTNNTVSSLAEAAQKIGEVVGLINNIASQTNLLALNATIEAARAGEAGKGFAVVASEVKNLANQTAKATDDIQAQVGQIQSVTGEAVNAINGITATITRINEIATTIAAAVEEQGAATNEIARNVQQAAQGTQQVSGTIADVTQAASRTGDMAADTLKAAVDVSRQTDTMLGEIDKFIRQIRGS
ncbi:MAG: methyl-accepting chemotaxis protein [Rhodospirillaceae bacterium]